MNRVLVRVMARYLRLLMVTLAHMCSLFLQRGESFNVIGRLVIVRWKIGLGVRVSLCVLFFRLGDIVSPTIVTKALTAGPIC